MRRVLHLRVRGSCNSPLECSTYWGKHTHCHPQTDCFVVIFSFATLQLLYIELSCRFRFELTTSVFILIISTNKNMNSPGAII